jgi:hypothetical protein
MSAFEMGQDLDTGRVAPYSDMRGSYILDGLDANHGK